MTDMSESVSLSQLSEESTPQNKKFGKGKSRRSVFQSKKTTLTRRQNTSIPSHSFKMIFGTRNREGSQPKNGDSRNLHGIEKKLTGDSSLMTEDLSDENEKKSNSASDKADKKK